ncbi:MAG: DUF2283 domain-containing protein [Chloroflexota bacterium]
MAAGTREYIGEQIVRLAYDRASDTLSVRLREAPSIERTEDVGQGRHIEYAGGQLVGMEFRNVREDIRTEGLPAAVAAMVSAALTFVATVRVFDHRPTGDDDVTAVPDDETAYLLRSPRNRKRLLAAYEQAQRGEGEPTDLEQLRREVELTNS